MEPASMYSGLVVTGEVLAMAMERFLEAANAAIDRGAPAEGVGVRVCARYMAVYAAGSDWLEQHVPE